MKNTSTNPRPQSPEHTQAALESETAGLLLDHVLTLCYLQRRFSGTLHRFCLCSENNLQGKEQTSLRILRHRCGEGEGKWRSEPGDGRPLPRKPSRHRLSLYQQGPGRTRKQHTCGPDPRGLLGEETVPPSKAGRLPLTCVVAHH